jgi:hypothetical protein
MTSPATAKHARPEARNPSHATARRVNHPPDFRPACLEPIISFRSLPFLPADELPAGSDYRRMIDGG